jgi:hypothetical protein
MTLFPQDEWMWSFFSFKTDRPGYAMSVHHQPKQGVLHAFLTGHRRRSATTNMFLSLDMLIEKISLLADTSIATH